VLAHVYQLKEGIFLFLKQKVTVFFVSSLVVNFCAKLEQLAQIFRYVNSMNTLTG
jgi:hypothetical protein